MVRGIVVAALLVATVVTGTAQASQVFGDRGGVSYWASAGEANALVVDVRGASHGVSYPGVPPRCPISQYLCPGVPGAWAAAAVTAAMFEDTGATIAAGPTSSCVASGSRAVCASPGGGATTAWPPAFFGSTYFSLGDGDDSFRYAEGAPAIAATIDGGPGDDVLTGGTGDNWLSGGTGADIIAGGAGFDAIDSYDERRDTVSCGAGGSDRVRADATDDVAADCELVERVD